MDNVPPTRRRLRALRLCGPLVVTACALEGTTDLPMDPTSFDPVGGIEAARHHAGPEAELLGFEARFVRSDGTMDLSATYHPTLSYEFVHPNRSHEEAPIGTGKNDRAFEVVEIEAKAPHWVHRKSTGGCSGTFHHEGLRRSVTYGGREKFDRRTPPPGCDLKTLWRVAREKNSIPEGAVAVIEFSGAGYEFELRDLDIHLWFTPSCEPIDETEFWARESEIATPPAEREKQATKRREAKEREAAEKAEREAAEAERLARLAKAREQALERLRATHRE